MRRVSLLASLLSLLVMWQLLHEASFMYGRWPSVLDVAGVYADFSALEELGGAAARTLVTVFGALSVGLSLGALVGLALAAGGPMSTGPYHALNALRSVPITVMIPVFLASFGLRWFLVPLIATPVMALMGTNLFQAIRQSGEPRRRLLSLMRFRPVAYFLHVVPWEAADALLATLRIVLPLALAIEIAIDYFINTNQGLGAFIALAYQRPGDEALMFAGILAVASLGIVSVMLIDRLGLRVSRWKQGI